MEFIKPTTERLIKFMEGKIYHNKFSYGHWNYRDRPVTPAMNVQFVVPENLVVWTTVARNEEEQKRTGWLATIVGHPRKVWWEKFKDKLNLGTFDNQRVIWWATCQAGPHSIPMLQAIMGILPQDYKPQETSLRLVTLMERDPEKLKAMHPEVLRANTISQKQADYFGSIGLHSVMAVAAGVVTMESETA